MRVWVSGARGFVGSWLAPRLAERGHVVIAAGREVDVGDARAVDAAIAAARPDAIVHLAALASVSASQDAALETARINYAGTLHVLRAAAQHAPRARVVLASSGEIYGGSAEPRPLDETTRLAPDTPYARSKAAADLVAARFAEDGLEVVRLRPFNHTGAGQRDLYVAASFARQVAEIECGRRAPLLHVGNLDAVRDFLDVEDVIDAYVRLLEAATATGAFNVASGVGRPIRALLEGLLERSGVAARIEVDPARWRPARASVGDATRLARATGWAPRIAFGVTLDRLLADWRRRIAASP